MPAPLEIGPIPDQELPVRQEWEGPDAGEFVRPAYEPEVVDRCRLMVRDPLCIHAYWEIKESTELRARAELGEAGANARRVLRVHDFPAGEQPSEALSGFVDLELSKDDTNRYVTVGPPQRGYRADVGLLAASGLYFPMTSSNVVITPPNGQSDVERDDWAASPEEAERISSEGLVPSGGEGFGSDSGADRSDRPPGGWDGPESDRARGPVDPAAGGTDPPRVGGDPGSGSTGPGPAPGNSAGPAGPDAEGNPNEQRRAASSWSGAAFWSEASSGAGLLEAFTEARAGDFGPTSAGAWLPWMPAADWTVPLLSLPSSPFGRPLRIPPAPELPREISGFPGRPEFPGFAAGASMPAAAAPPVSKLPAPPAPEMERNVWGPLPSSGSLAAPPVVAPPAAVPAASAAHTDAAGEAPPAPGRGLWFTLKTELIVYGATEPGATVTLQGIPVRVRPDGTFSVRIELPDGRQVLDTVATSADGLESRVITPIVTRTTESGPA